MIATKKITHHTELLNTLIEKHNLKSYLEIGVQNPANNFDNIRCIEKYGIDPNVNAKGVYKGTSDSYFETCSKYDPIPQWDLIFIDGLHHADQVKRDFDNSLRCLTDKGFIVIHDTLPDKEEYTTVPRTTKIWYGDVYKFAMNELRRYSGINYVTIDIDCGCTVVWKTDKVVNVFKPVLETPATWSDYLLMRKAFLNIIQPSEIETRISYTRK